MRVRAGLHLGFLTCIAAVLVAWSWLGVSVIPGRGTDSPLPASEPPERRLYVHDGGLVIEVPTKADTVHRALDQAGLVLKPGDFTTPDPSRPVTSGAHVYIDRARDVTILADGEEHGLRTRGATVGDVLRQSGLSLGALDRLAPDLDAPVTPGLWVQLTRVRVERQVVEEALPFHTVYRPDNDVEIGHEWVAEPGQMGLHRTEYVTWYENDQEIHQVVDKEYLERTPQARIVAYGTKIVPRYVDTATGAIQYYKTLRVWATWYTPWSADPRKRPGHPGYGITSLGMRVQRGIIAVDPRVIPYGTQIYVPGYGVGIAADTGGGIVGNKIDLGFADHEAPDWRTGWADVYLLGPP